MNHRTNDIDMVVFAQRIISMTGGPDATALAIAAGHIVWMGAAHHARTLVGPATRSYDFGHATITPGLTDAHLHTVHFGISLSQVDLRPRVTSGIAGIIRKVSERAGGLQPGSWVLGRGYDQNRLAERRHPTRWDLDLAAPDGPVLVTQNSGHMSVANSAALLAAGITRDTPSPDGGAIVKDEHGEPTGLLQETAQQLVRRHIPHTTADDVREAFRLAHRQFAIEGLTSVHEAGCPAAHPAEIGLYQEALADGDLNARTYLMIYPQHLDPQLTLGLGLRTGLGRGDGMLTVGPLKLMADGSLIGLTAQLDAPFAGHPLAAGAETGLWVNSPAEIRRIATTGHRNGWQLATHAIGDRAIRLVLDAYADAAATRPRADTRHRIEHCGVLTADLIARLAATRTIPVTQPRFISELGDGFRTALGEERLALTYPLRSLLEAGIPVAAGSDRPVVDGAPLLGIHDAVNQRTASGAAYAPGEAVTFRQALAMYTVNAAYAAYQETGLGRLAPGMIADLTVIGGDPEADPSHIAELGILGTMVGGRWTHLA